MIDIIDWNDLEKSEKLTYIIKSLYYYSIYWNEIYVILNITYYSSSVNIYKFSRFSIKMIDFPVIIKR